MKASSQAFVSVTDKPLTTKMEKLAQNAEYFEQQAPWDAKYKKKSFTPPTVKAIETIVETGDFSVTTIGDNLPNENEIHEKYGTKNFLFTGSSRALYGRSRPQNDQGICAQPDRDRSRHQVRPAGQRNDDRFARSHRSRLRQAERAREERRPSPT